MPSVKSILHPHSSSYYILEKLTLSNQISFELANEIMLYICSSKECPTIWENCAKLLLQEIADPNYTNTLGASLLVNAVKNEHLQLVQILLENKANPKATDEHGISCFEIVLERLETFDEEIAQLLLLYGVNPKGVDRFDRPWLNLIAHRPEASALCFELLHAGACPDKKDPSENTPLTCAARDGNAAGISLLLSEGANANICGPAGLSPLSIALGARHPPRKPGMSKIDDGHMRCALRLMKSAGSKNLDADGLPPLLRLWRSTLRFEPIWMQQLISAGADINQQDKDGNTLLHWISIGSTQSGINMGKWALGLGANTQIYNNQKKLPHELAWERKNENLAHLLQSAYELEKLNMLLPQIDLEQNESRGKDGKSKSKYL